MTGAATQQSVLVVEDEPEMAKLLKSALINCGYAVSAVSSQREAREAVAADAPDAMILDLVLPDGNALDFLRSIRDSGNNVPVIVLTAYDSVPNRVLGLEVGANDYMGKPFDMSELVARLRAALRSAGGVPMMLLELGNIGFDVERQEVRIDGKVVEISTRERQLLAALMRSAERVVPKSDLREEVFGGNAEISASRLDVIVHRLRRKLSAQGAMPTVHTFRGVGYMIA